MGFKALKKNGYLESLYTYVVLLQVFKVALKAERSRIIFEAQAIKFFYINWCWKIWLLNSILVSDLTILI